MTNIKTIVEIALNDGYAVPRYDVEKVEVGRTMITAYYFDRLAMDKELLTIQFAI